MPHERPLLNPWSERPIEVRNHTLDSTRWYDFSYRDGDIVIATWAKTGTTWLQQIIAQLIFGPIEGIPVLEYSPWIDNRCFDSKKLFEMLDGQTHRRFVKSHLPANALVYFSRAKYLYIGRDGCDVIWSWYQHHRNLAPRVYEMLEHTPGRVGPPMSPPVDDPRQYFNEWLDRDGYPLWPFWSHVQSWWELRNRPNVLLLHFTDLKSDLAEQIRRIASFLEIELKETDLPRICEYCSFSYMKTHASELSPALGRALRGGAGDFFNHGEGGRWRDTLTAEDVLKYRRHMQSNLSSECARWLGGGASATREIAT